MTADTVCFWGCVPVMTLMTVLAIGRVAYLTVTGQLPPMPRKEK